MHGEHHCCTPPFDRSLLAAATLPAVPPGCNIELQSVACLFPDNVQQAGQRTV